jgi:hypothetical protein
LTPKNHSTPWYSTNFGHQRKKFYEKKQSTSGGDAYMAATCSQQTIAVTRFMDRFFLRSESARTVYRSKTNDVTDRKREEKKDRFCDGNSCHVCKN